jgi:hypothetical protein
MVIGMSDLGLSRSDLLVSQLVDRYTSVVASEGWCCDGKHWLKVNLPGALPVSLGRRLADGSFTITIRRLGLACTV